MVKSLYKILRSALWTLLIAYITIYSALRLDAVQSFVAQCTTDALVKVLHTEVHVGRIDYHPLNRITIDDVHIKDLDNRNMLGVGRLSVTIGLWDLVTTGRISITSLQLFGAQVALVKKTPESPLNCQFVIDAFSSKDTTSHTPLNLKIASLIIRGTSLSYDLLSAPVCSGRFDTNHLNVSNISGNIQVNHITDKTFNINIKRLSAIEHSGARLTNLSGNVNYMPGSVTLSNVQLLMPDTYISVPVCNANFCKTDSGGIKPGTLRYALKLQAMRLNLRDIQPFLAHVDLTNVAPFQAYIQAHGSDASSKVNANIKSLTRPEDIVLKCTASLHDILGTPYGNLRLQQLSVSNHIVTALASPLHLPEILQKLGNLNAQGNITMSSPTKMNGAMTLAASSVGEVKAQWQWNDRNIKAHVETERTQLDGLLDNSPLGALAANINVTTKLSRNIPDNKRASSKLKLSEVTAKGNISLLEYNNYAYTGIEVDAHYTPASTTGRLVCNDPALRFSADGTFRQTGRAKSACLNVDVSHIQPTSLHLALPHSGDIFSGRLSAQGQWSTINDFLGTLQLTDVTVRDLSGQRSNATLSNLTATSTLGADGQKNIILYSDIADAAINGSFRLTTLPTTLTNIVSRRLGAVSGMPAYKATEDNITLTAQVKDLTFVKRLVNLPVSLPLGLHLDGFVNAPSNTAQLTFSADSIDAFGMKWTQTAVNLQSPGDTLGLTLATTMLDAKGKPVHFTINNKAADNQLNTQMKWDNLRARKFKGDVAFNTHFAQNAAGQHVTTITIPQSVFTVGDSVWSIHLNEAQRVGQTLKINNLHVGSATQWLHANGFVSGSPQDSITASLCNIDVSYILDLINFHSVSFDGQASGNVVARGMLSDLTAQAKLTVQSFCFDTGRMGTLYANANYTTDKGLINIDAVAQDTAPYGSLGIKGYIQPSPGAIDLRLSADTTRLEFMKKYCGGFMSDIDLTGTGNVRVHGPFSAILLTGDMIARGGFTLTSTGCHYTMPGDSVNFLTDAIQFNNAPIIDNIGGHAILNGAIHHRHLSRMTYDLALDTRSLLAFDQPTLEGDETFGGYAIINGKVGIDGRGNMLDITADATTLPGSYIIYDASSTVSNQNASFITWESKNDNAKNNKPEDEEDDNDRTNIRMNFLVNATPDTKLHLIMDRQTGDCIDLYGKGTLRIDYYNKGGMEIYGNYLADHGTYKMTIQKLIRRDFQFVKDGLITFSGDPYQAVLNLQAKYAINSVSLADLNLGSSFKTNNVPVNCLMNITGTAEQPKLEFALDLPSLSTDARQMIYTAINSEEEMNQQVLYLLAVGRFYSQNEYNQDASSSSRMGQGSLAMQSFLSGTLSQQFNNVMSKVIGSSQWSFGANVAPGSEGYNNAEYEGTLSGRLFNSRLIFRGQFGYRDNVNNNSSNFIGDFNLSYLLTRSGSIALKVYNQANDRYFTRSSLNTQGIGIMFQKEFGK